MRKKAASIALDYIKDEMADLVKEQMEESGQSLEEAKRHIIDGVVSVVESISDWDVRIGSILAKVAQNVDLKDLSEMELKKMAIRDNIKAENDAIMMYSKYIDLLPAGDPVRNGLEDIRDEERAHTGELHQLLVSLDPEEQFDFDEGVAEVKKEQGVKDPKKMVALKWAKDGVMPGAWSARTRRGEYLVLPPEETGYEGHVAYLSVDGCSLDGAVGGSLVSPKTFGSAEEAKRVVERIAGRIAVDDGGWDTDGITFTLEEDGVKLFVEPERDRWRWDAYVDDELYDTGLSGSAEEAKADAESCVERCGKTGATEYPDALAEVKDALDAELEYGDPDFAFHSEDDVRYFIKDWFQQSAFEYGFDNDEWMDKTDYVVNNLDLSRYVTAKLGRGSRSR